MPRTALITGITGQDGSYLAELLISKGYEVHGFLRPEEGAGCLPADVYTRLSVHTGLVDSYEEVAAAVETSRPDECYHLAAQTFVQGEECATMRTNSSGTHHVLAALRDYAPNCRMFLAGSSEMFGEVDHSPQSEATPMHPRNVYGISKVAAYMLMRHYREASGLHASCGILYNHESPRRGEQFVTRKITRSAALIREGKQKELRLGNLDAVRDWGDARDYVEAMWLMLQQPNPDDYVIATGQGRTVRDFLDAAFRAVDLDWSKYVVVDERFYRPAEKYSFVGDASKAEERLNWSRKRDFAALVKEMVSVDLGGRPDA
jgi:GDPmannose 4,6-dehydratase